MISIKDRVSSSYERIYKDTLDMRVVLSGVYENNLPMYVKDFMKSHVVGHNKEKEYINWINTY